MNSTLAYPVIVPLNTGAAVDDAGWTDDAEAFPPLTTSLQVVTAQLKVIRISIRCTSWRGVGVG